MDSRNARRELVMLRWGWETGHRGNNGRSPMTLKRFTAEVEYVGQEHRRRIERGYGPTMRTPIVGFFDGDLENAIGAAIEKVIDKWARHQNILTTEAEWRVVSISEE
jgi:hypothetical protein